MKQWLYKCSNDEGITNFDIIVGCVAVLFAFIAPLLLSKIFY